MILKFTGKGGMQLEIFFLALLEETNVLLLLFFELQCCIYHLKGILPFFTADVFVTYVRDEGSTNLFPEHLYNIYLSHYS